MISKHKSAIYQAYFGLATLEGVAALYFSIATRSMERNAWLFGLSLPRLLLVVVLLGVMALLAWLSYKSVSDQGWLVRVTVQVDQFGSNRLRLILSVLGLWLVVLVGLGLFYLWRSELMANLPYIVQVTLQRLTPALAWVNLLSIQTLWILSPRLLTEFQTNLISRPERFRLVLLSSSLMAAFVHWAILVFQWSAFKIPYWFWNYRDHKAGMKELVFLGVFALVMVVLRLVLQNPERTWRNILMIVALGYAVQLGFGIAQGQGFESMRLKYLSSGNSTFSENACGNVGVLESMKRYNEIYGSGFWEGTKPPGLQALFILFGEGVKAIAPGDS